MDLRGFIEERKPAWRRLEELLAKADLAAFKLSEAEAQELGALYRRASADLCRAQARTANAELLRYLNALVARAYGMIYSGRKFRWLDVWDFFARAFPALVRARAGAVGLATALVLLGAVFGYVAAALDEDARHFLVPDAIRQATEKVAETVASNQQRALGGGEAGIVSSTIMTNNMRVAFLAFALGVTFGFGTAIVLFYNGLMLGVLAAYFHREGFALDFWATILPHGVIELMAIFIAGGAGLRIGGALLAPGLLTRTQALRRAGAEAVRLVVGTTPMLFVAGTIEGYITPQGFIPPLAKLAFAFATALALAAYFAPRDALARVVRLAR